MKLGIVIHSTVGETVWNAFRLGIHALKEGDDVRVFLLAGGVDCESLTTDQFNIADQMRVLVDAGGEILACGTCLKIRRREGTETCPSSSLGDLYDIIRESERLLTF